MAAGLQIVAMDKHGKVTQFYDISAVDGKSLTFYNEEKYKKEKKDKK